MKLFFSIVFLFAFFCSKSQNTGYAIREEGYCFKTTDGGVNWTNIGAVAVGPFTSISFPDVNTGYAIREEGYCFKTTDGGVNWTNIGAVAVGPFTSISFPDVNTGYAIREEGY
ncbi:MAG: WD40/YVTN/BNR-like repeat-containing protein, partial [Bacteroidota bacterium]